MSMIDPTARIEDGAVIGEGTSIGPYCVIGPHVVIGANCKLVAHVYVTAQTTIGDGCTIYPFVSLGTAPQSLAHRGFGRYARERLPGVDADDFDPISCTYTTTASSDFVLDRVGPVVVATGFSGHGFKFTPAIGRVLADLALTGDRPDARFALEAS